MTSNHGLISLCGAIILATAVAGGQVDEHTMKAVAFERIARFVEWPSDAHGSSTDGPFVIGVLGKSRLQERLKAIYARHKIKGRTVEVRGLAELARASQSHLLYIPGSEEKTLDAILSITRGKPVLTIGDTRGFAKRGVLVNLFVRRSKLRFEINERGLHEAGLSVDPLLLKVATIVNPRGPKP